jgi:hypothetical protein
MDIQRELKNDLTSIKGAIETQEGIYIPLKEVERMLNNRIQQVKNNDLLHSVSDCDNPHCEDGVTDEIYGEKIYCSNCENK